MPACRHLAVLVLLTAALGGCVQPSDEGGSFALVTVSGEIVERGEERDEYACDAPIYEAGLALENRELTIREAAAPEEPLRLGLWDDVLAVHAGNWSACEWPVLTPSGDEELTWTLQHNAFERNVSVELDGDALVVDGARLQAGEVHELAIDASAEAGEATYTYRGNLTFAFQGVWSPDRLEVVDEEDDLVGARGTIGPPR